MQFTGQLSVQFNTSWRKLHIAVNEDHCIEACVLADRFGNDANRTRKFVIFYKIDKFLNAILSTDVTQRASIMITDITREPVIPTKVGIQDWNGLQQLDSRFRGNNEAVSTVS